MNPPAFNRSVQAAEAELSLQLFGRGNAEISCTPARTFVIERARTLLLRSRCPERDVDLYRERVMGDVSFGASFFPAATRLPQLMIDLRTGFPGDQLPRSRQQLPLPESVALKEEIGFSLADVRDVPGDANFVRTAIGRHRSRFYVRSGHPLASRHSVKLMELIPYGLAGARLPEKVEAGFRKLFGRADDERLPIAVECDDLQLFKRITLGTDTVMVGTEGIVRGELAAGLLQPFEMQALPRSQVQIGEVTLKGRSHSPMTQYALDFLGELAARQEAEAAALACSLGQ